MCIIAAKPRGVEMPSDEFLQNMWDNNEDGAGFMYAKDGKVFIEKGFMKYAQFKAALKRVKKTTDLTAVPIVMHFRITTHGGTKPENCHPFPVTESVGKLKKLTQTASLGVAHNGIIHNTPRKGISDTMEYIATQLAPLYKGVPRFYLNQHLVELIKNATESKLAFLDAKGDIYTIGQFMEEGGILYSNFSYSYHYTPSKYLCSTWDYEYKKWDSIPRTTYKAGKIVPLTGSSDIDELADDGIDYPNPDTYKLSLMWLSEWDGEFVIDEDGKLYDEDFLIDINCHVYKYSYNLDCCVPCPDFRAYTGNGMSLAFDGERATLEVITDDCAMKGEVLTATSRT